MKRRALAIPFILAFAAIIVPSSLSGQQIYTTVNMNGWVLLTANGTAEFRNFWGNPAGHSMHGSLAITICASYTLWSTGFSNPPASWSGEVSCFSYPGYCHRAQIDATSNEIPNLTQGAGSSRICIPPPQNEGPCKYPNADGSCPPTGSTCTEYDENCSVSPIVIGTRNSSYRLSDVGTDPVSFDIDADGEPDTTAWTARDSGLLFLALDRNGNARIDDGSELFGVATPLASGKAPNGFEALKQYDGNGDNVIDAADAVWNRLLLWDDNNHNGRSEAGEQTRLADSEITALGLSYHWTGRHDQYGNALRYAGKLEMTRGQKNYYDVFFRVSN